MDDAALAAVLVAAEPESEAVELSWFCSLSVAFAETSTLTAERPVLLKHCSAGNSVALEVKTMSAH